MENLPTVPFYALADNDPHGLAIVSTYKYGSAKLAQLNHELTARRLQWLGVRSWDVVSLVKPLTGGGNVDPCEIHGLMSLTNRDRRLAINMLERGSYEQDGQDPEWMRELQVMLMLNMKAEIQVLEQREGGITQWLKEALIRG